MQHKPVYSEISKYSHNCSCVHSFLIIGNRFRRPIGPPDSIEHTQYPFRFPGNALSMNPYLAACIPSKNGLSCIRATFSPCSAAAIDAAQPAIPPPTMTRSKVLVFSGTSASLSIFLRHREVPLDHQVEDFFSVQK